MLVGATGDEVPHTHEPQDDIFIFRQAMAALSGLRSTPTSTGHATGVYMASPGVVMCTRCSSV